VAGTVALVVALTGVVATGGGSATAATRSPSVAPPPVVLFGASDAVSIPVLTGTYYVNDKMAASLPNWWDHPALTATVRADPAVDPAKLQAAHNAIQLWGEVLATRLPGLSLTDVTAKQAAQRPADIVIHLVPHAGGIVWGGNAICGKQRCLNVLVKYTQPPGQAAKGQADIADFDPLRVERETLHELGHALGLGHPTPLESIDVMGYGWATPDPDVTPILSNCDLSGIRTSFGWFFANEPPHPSPVSAVTC
jgi:hypothetical protein